MHASNIEEMTSDMYASLPFSECTRKSRFPSPISVSSSCVHMFFTAISLNGVTLSMSPAAVSRALTVNVKVGHACVASASTSSVCFSASLDLRVPTLKFCTVLEESGGSF